MADASAQPIKLALQCLKACEDGDTVFQAAVQLLHKKFCFNFLRQLRTVPVPNGTICALSDIGTIPTSVADPELAGHYKIRIQI